MFSIKASDKISAENIHPDLRKEFNEQQDYLINFPSQELANFKNYMQSIVSGLQTADPKSIDKFAGLFEDGWKGTPADFVYENNPYDKFPIKVLVELKHDNPDKGRQWWDYWIQECFLSIPSAIEYLMVDEFSVRILGDAGLEGWYDEITSENNINTRDLYEAGNTLKELSDDFISFALKKTDDLRSELAKYQMGFVEEFRIQEGASRMEKTAKDIADTITDEALSAHDDMDEYTASGVNKMLPVVIKMFKEMRDEAVAYDEITRSDIATTDAYLADLEDINNRSKTSDIRSINDNLLRKEDSKIVFSKMHNHWRSISKRLDSSTTKNFDGVPSYRYNVGETVRITSSNRKGKIVGARKEQGTGKQLYDVKVNGVDKPKTYKLSEIRRD